MADLLTILDAEGIRLVTVTVAAYNGTTGTGAPAYAAPATVTAYVEERSRLVRAPNGAEVVSGTTVLVAPDTVAPPASLVTLPSGRVTRVITAAAHHLTDGPDVFDHLELACE